VTIKKAILLAGGFGTRISEETSVRPKPLIEIGGQPIIWHIMKNYYAAGIDEFIICLGYKGYMIKEYFSNYYLHTSDVTIDHKNNTTTYHKQRSEDWKITMVDTGDGSMTGGRIKRIAPYIEDGEHFCMTYGDGVSDVDIKALLKTHQAHGREATVTVVTPPGRFGAIDFDGDKVVGFREKPKSESGWINGGFFVLSSDVFDRIEGDKTIWEREPMESLAKEDQLYAYKHSGFWHPMDTLRDKNHLEGLWESGKAPWKNW